MIEKNSYPISRISPFYLGSYILLSTCLSLPIGSTPSAQAKRDPSSQPTQDTQPSVDSKTHVDQDKAVLKHKGVWGEGTFGRELDPHTLHRIEENEGVAIFAGGCFWCMEAPFEKLKGVVSVHSGYTGGESASPTYAQVSASQTKHLEAVIVFYRPREISYEKLLYHYWRSVNPIQADGQFADRGLQYTTAIFTIDEAQHEAAIHSKEELNKSGKFDAPIAVKIRNAKLFWPAEGYHQDYYKTNAGHYLRYKQGSGRAGYLKQTWGIE